MFKVISLLFFLVISLFSFDINSASAEDFMEIKGIGKKTANRIISYRDSNGFNSIDDLLNIKGVGKKKIAQIKNYSGSSESEEREVAEDNDEAVIDLSKYD